MMRWKRLSLFAVVGMAIASAASAQDAGQEDEDNYTYFARSGTDRASVIADWEECRDVASPVQPPPAGYVYQPTVVGAAAAGFIQGLVRGAQRRHMFDAALRKCMSVKGFTRMGTSKEEAKRLYDGKWEVMREKLADKALAPGSADRRLEP